MGVDGRDERGEPAEGADAVGRQGASPRARRRAGAEDSAGAEPRGSSDVEAESESAGAAKGEDEQGGDERSGQEKGEAAKSGDEEPRSGVPRQRRRNPSSAESPRGGARSARAAAGMSADDGGSGGRADGESERAAAVRRLSKPAPPAPTLGQDGASRAGTGAATPPPHGKGVPKQRGRRPQATAGQSDAELVARMREGDAAAYDALYRRHVAPVRRYARTCCRDADTAEDLANEVFARTLQAVRGGKGPHSAVRAYLMTSVRHTAAAWARSSKREQLVEDFAVFAETAEESRGGVEGATDPGADVRAMQEAEQTLVVRAFRSLSEHDQMVLWHTAVEGAKPQDVAPLLGKSKGATATAAHRARENLKQAYLQAHVSRARTGSADCARYADRLGAYARGGLRLRAERGLLRHLDGCAECRKAALEVKDLNQHIRVLVPVAFVGWFATAGGAKAFGALVAGGTAAGSAVAGGAAASSGAGGAASEGLGTPAKVGMGLGLVAAVAAVAYALVGGGGEPKPRSQAQPPVAAPEKPSAEPEEPGPPAPAPPKPKPTPPQEPAQEPTPAKKAPSPSPTRTSPQPEPTPSERPAPPAPPPSESPSPPPSSPPPPPPTDYHLGRLDYDFTPGEATDPTIRTQPGSWAWQRTDLRLAGTSYASGISMHLPSSVTVDLNRSCVSFAALAGIDDLSPGRRAAHFAVHGDGRELWRSGTVRNGSRPAAVRVPLEGVESLRLSVEPARPFDRLALADWADARISCA